MLRAISCPVSYCPVSWQVPPPYSPLPATPISYYQNNRKFLREAGQANRVYDMGLGGVGIFQKPSNLVRYYTLGGILWGLFYLPRKILCVTYDRAGYYVMIG